MVATPRKIFISHSSKDEKVVKAFVNLIGFTEKNIVCSSVPETKIALAKISMNT